MFFKSEAGTSSGPFALCTSKLESRAVTPSMVTVNGDISGKGQVSKGGIAVLSSFVKTDVK